MELHLDNKKTKFNIPVGIWKNGRQFELVWLTRNDKLCTVSIMENQADKISDIVLTKTLKADGITLKTPERHYRFYYISALSPHLIWSKTVILSGDPTVLECEQFCEFTLSRELPFTIDDVHFDYRKQPVTQSHSGEQSSQIDIFAVHKKTAQEYVESLLPIKITILDHSAYCLLRALHVIRSTEMLDPDTLWIYHDRSGFIVIRQQQFQLQVMQQSECKDLNELKNKFVTRYGGEVKHCVAMSCNKFRYISLPPEMEFQPMPVPFIAFGCALWGEDHKILHKLEIDLPEDNVEPTGEKYQEFVEFYYGEESH